MSNPVDSASACRHERAPFVRTPIAAASEKERRRRCDERRRSRVSMELGTERCLADRPEPRKASAVFPTSGPREGACRVHQCQAEQSDASRSATADRLSPRGPGHADTQRRSSLGIAVRHQGRRSEACFEVSSRFVSNGTKAPSRPISRAPPAEQTEAQGRMRQMRQSMNSTMARRLRTGKLPQRQVSDRPRPSLDAHGLREEIA